VLTRIFAEAGVKIEDRLDLVRLDPQWRCFFDDGTRIDLGEDVGAMAGEMDRFAPGTKAGDGYRRFQGLAEHLHGVSERFFFWKPVEDMLDTFDLKANLNPNTLRDVLSLRMGSSVAGTIRAKVKDKRLAQMLDHFVQYVGSSPYGSPAVLCSIATCRPPTGSGTRWAARRAVGDGAAQAGDRAGCEFGPARR
jgi:phytoene dehydrogenase-like protein